MGGDGNMHDVHDLGIGTGGAGTCFSDRPVGRGMELLL
jgi:hypothetical protein